MNPKNSHRTSGIGLWAVLFFIGFIPLSISQAAVVKQVAILPLVIHAPERMDYLREGIQDMFASRLTWEDKVVVIDNARVQKAREKISGPLDESRAVELGKQLGVDVVLWGSINVLGTGVSLDISVVNITLRQAVKKFFAQAKGVDEIILRVGELSDMINERVFDRAQTSPTAGAVTGASQPKSPEPSGETASPGKAPISLKGFTINPASPQIIIRSGGVEMGGVWRSTFLPLVLVDMAFGDLEGDGKIETVLISKKRIYIYRFNQDRFQLIKEIPGGRFDNFISVDVADIHGTGRPQIFVTNYRGNSPKSMVLSWSGGAYKTVARDIPYYLRVHQLPGRGTVLLGQQKYGEQLFDTKIMILSWKEGKYIPVERLKVPEGLTIYNFIILASNPGDPQEILHLNAFNRLMVLSEKGKAKYSSKDPYGGTINSIQEPEPANPMGLAGKDETPLFIPSRLIVASLSDPGKKEIILNKNKGSVLNFLARYQAYTSGEIFSLSWDGRILKENWKTPVINDYIANYGIADFKNNGQKQLVVGIVQSTGVPLVSEARSLIYCYDLGAGSPNPK